MDMEGFRSWLESYGRAWESRDPQIFVDLFADDASYYVNPFSELISGRSALRDYWSNIISSQEQARFDYEVLAITQDSGIAHWWTSFVYVSSKTKVKLDGIFVVSLISENRCKVLRQWWHWLEYS
jgi:hypothetical protein